MSLSSLSKKEVLRGQKQIKRQVNVLNDTCKNQSQSENLCLIKLTLNLVNLSRYLETNFGNNKIPHCKIAKWAMSQWESP